MFVLEKFIKNCKNTKIYVKAIKIIQIKMFTIFKNLGAQ